MWLLILFAVGIGLQLRVVVSFSTECLPGQLNEVAENDVTLALHRGQLKFAYCGVEKGMASVFGRDRIGEALPEFETVRARFGPMFILQWTATRNASSDCASFFLRSFGDNLQERFVFFLFGEKF